MGTKRLPSGHCTQTVCPASDLYIFANIFAFFVSLAWKRQKKIFSLVLHLNRVFIFVFLR